MKKSDTLKADELLYTDNYSSWRRMVQLARLYMPILRPCIISYFVIILALGIVNGIGSRYIGADVWPALLLAIPVDIMWIFAPTTLTRRDYRFVSQQLPVTAAEKLWFLLITYLIVFPIVILVSLTLSEMTVKWSMGISLESILPGVSARMTVLGLLQVVILTIISLYYTVTASNRAFAGMVAALVAYLAYLFLSGLVMFGAGVYFGFTQPDNYVDPTSPQMQPIIEQATIMSQYVISGIFAIVGLRYIQKLYKYLRNSGF